MYLYIVNWHDKNCGISFWIEKCFHSIVIEFNALLSISISFQEWKKIKCLYQFILFLYLVFVHSFHVNCPINGEFDSIWVIWTQNKCKNQYLLKVFYISLLFCVCVCVFFWHKNSKHLLSISFLSVFLHHMQEPMNSVFIVEVFVYNLFLKRMKEAEEK